MIGVLGWTGQPSAAEPGSLYLVSITGDGEKANRASWEAAVGDDEVVFVSEATNLDARDTDWYPDVYTKDLVSGSVELVSVRPDGVKGNFSALSPSVSADGTKVAFSSGATNLSPGDTDEWWDIYLKDLVSGTLTLVSTGSDGAKANGFVGQPSLSADGAKMAFTSAATNLTPADSSSDIDLFVKDLVTGSVQLVTVDTNAYSVGAHLSGDGSRVLFQTQESLDPRDGDTYFDVYVADLGSGEIFLVDTTESGEKADWGAYYGVISGDGTKAAFQTIATNLDPADTDPNDDLDIYVKDLQTGALTLVSRGSSASARLSWDGARVAFESRATDLHPDDSEYYLDVYVRDLRTGAVTLASSAADGRNSDGADAHVTDVSADGTRVAFSLDGPGSLDSRDTDSLSDIYLKQLPAPTDNHPPDCRRVTVSPDVLTPPARYEFTRVQLAGATDLDGDRVTYSTTGVTQDEPVVGRGDVTTPDARRAAGNSVEVRAERSPEGDGRVYRVAYDVADGRGGLCTGTAKIAVPRSKKQTAVDSEATYNSFG
jgi:Tol biopolymer transport system component